MRSDFLIEPHRISYVQQGETLAYILFPFEGESEALVNITSTYVDPSLRGRGVASQLMKAVIAKAEEKNWHIKPTCSYAVRWFEGHPEHSALLES